jgi:hypothetical protein
MSINKTKHQRIKDLIDRTSISTQSVNWWEKEMDNILSEMDRWESSDSPKAEDELDRLKDKLELLIPRAKMEIEVINNLEKELGELQQETGNEKTNKNKKKSNRNKSI